MDCRSGNYRHNPVCRHSHYRFPGSHNHNTPERFCFHHSDTHRRNRAFRRYLRPLIPRRRSHICPARSYPSRSGSHLDSPRRCLRRCRCPAHRIRRLRQLPCCRHLDIHQRNLAYHRNRDHPSQRSHTHTLLGSSYSNRSGNRPHNQEYHHCLNHRFQGYCTHTAQVQFSKGRLGNRHYNRLSHPYPNFFPCEYTRMYYRSSHPCILGHRRTLPGRCSRSPLSSSR